MTEGTSLPAAAEDTAGNGVVVWIDFQTTTPTLKARRFDALGAPAGGEIVIARERKPLRAPRRDDAARSLRRRLE